MKPGQRQIRWILRAQMQDTETLNQLIQWIQRPLYHYICRVTGDEHSGEDIDQETLLKIVHHLYWLREPACSTTWAFRIASRSAFQWLTRPLW